VRFGKGTSVSDNATFGRGGTASPKGQICYVDESFAMEVRKMRSLVVSALCIALCACAWVTLTPGGEKVRVLQPSDVATCQELGKTQVSLRAKVAGINRNEEEVAKELSMLARNAAADMGGDTVVPATPVTDGKRTYTVYKCVGAAEPH